LHVPINDSEQVGSDFRPQGNGAQSSQFCPNSNRNLNPNAVSLTSIFNQGQFSSFICVLF